MHIRPPPSFHRTGPSILTAAIRAKPSPGSGPSSSRFVNPRTALPLCLGLSFSYAIFPSPFRVRFDDGPSSLFSSSSAASGGRRTGGVPGSSSGRGAGGDGPLGLDQGTVRQITTGSILGLVAGLVFSMFSRTLTILLGLGIIGTQYLASRGIRLVPVETLQKYVKGVDFKKLIEKNPIIKFSFGVTFFLSAFGSF